MASARLGRCSRSGKLVRKLFVDDRNSEEDQHGCQPDDSFRPAFNNIRTLISGARQFDKKSG
jgi:hypothetical protein